MSWLRHFRGQAIPQVLGLNNLTNAKDKRLTAIHNEKEVFVFRIQHTKLRDSGKYECQVQPLINIFLFYLVPVRWPNADLLFMLLFPVTKKGTKTLPGITMLGLGTPLLAKKENDRL